MREAQLAVMVIPSFLCEDDASFGGWLCPRMLSFLSLSFSSDNLEEDVCVTVTRVLTPSVMVPIVLAIIDVVWRGAEYCEKLLKRLMILLHETLDAGITETDEKE